LELGYTHFDTAETYGGGHSEELLGRAMRETHTPRESLFIVSKVKPEHLRYENVLKSCEASLKRLAVDYLDLYLVHWPAVSMDLRGSFRALNKLVSTGKVHRLGVSNFDLRLLKSAEELSETPLLTDQVPFSLDDRSYAQNGVLSYCQAAGILVTAYSPINEGRLKGNQRVQAIAAAHSASPQQIALAWLVSQPCVIAIPRSLDPQHQKQNLEAADILLTESEMAQLE
jgi:diketogulonate reductase-like aldo/keto reductase